jgi:hypothetical protein
VTVRVHASDARQFMAPVSPFSTPLLAYLAVNSPPSPLSFFFPPQACLSCSIGTR